MLADSPSFFAGKRVLVTGHTGFKGAWLSWWLVTLGAEVSGFALEPESDDGVCLASGLLDLMDSRIGDLRDREAVERAVSDANPDVVFHCAAQALVLRSYADAVETFHTNVVGTTHVLEACRGIDRLSSIVVLTSDKCYENDGRSTGYCEGDPLGGFDPYSASKACAEIASASYRQSFFQQVGSAGLATARAGNVIGGGDWSQHRLVADFARSAISGEELVLRHPRAVRPWQHVLDPLSGYLMLAQRLSSASREQFSSAWNFGPAASDAVPVATVVDLLQTYWPGVRTRLEPVARDEHEAAMLQLDCSKARSLLGWRPRLHLEEAVQMTAIWYRQVIADRRNARALVQAQISAYEERVHADRSANSVARG